MINYYTKPKPLEFIVNSINLEFNLLGHNKLTTVKINRYFRLNGERIIDTSYKTKRKITYKQYQKLRTVVELTIKYRLSIVSLNLIEDNRERFTILMKRLKNYTNDKSTSNSR